MSWTAAEVYLQAGWASCHKIHTSSLFYNQSLQWQRSSSTLLYNAAADMMNELTFGVKGKVEHRGVATGIDIGTYTPQNQPN